MSQGFFLSVCGTLNIVRGSMGTISHRGKEFKGDSPAHA